MPLKSTPLRAALAVTALACACTTAAAADNALDRARRQNLLVVGMPWVMPVYVVNARFRTGESIDAALAEDVAKRLRVKAAAVPFEPAQRADALAARQAHILLAPVADGDPLRRTAAIVPTGHVTGAMAIMRTDTDIKSWEQLKGRSVCISEGSPYEGTMAARYGAQEQVHRAPTDALLALRTGKCDATVHDSALLEEILKMPEWKKFSARLPVQQQAPLSFVVPAGDAKTQSYLKNVAAEWKSSGHIPQLLNKAARSIAFEVYLDQNVPDCH